MSVARGSVRVVVRAGSDRCDAKPAPRFLLGQCEPRDEDQLRIRSFKLPNVEGTLSVSRCGGHTRDEMRGGVTAMNARVTILSRGTTLLGEITCRNDTVTRLILSKHLAYFIVDTPRSGRRCAERRVYDEGGPDHQGGEGLL